jgi:hypothetical protein
VIADPGASGAARPSPRMRSGWTGCAPWMPHASQLRRRAMAGLLAGLLVLLMPAPALAHGDAALVDGELVLAPGASAAFDGALHYHRLVGTVISDGAVRVRLVAARTGDEVVSFGPAARLSFNELIRCCDEAWAPHRLVIENVGSAPVTVVARAALVHDDLAVMVDGAESGTRLSIALLGAGWWMLAWRTARRPRSDVLLRRSAVGLALLATAVLVIGSYAAARYGVSGAPSVVAGNADVPVLPLNEVVSRASLLIGVAMVGWVIVARWWIRARPPEPRASWLVVGMAMAGAVVVVAVSVSAAYGGPLVQLAWTVAAAGPIVTMLAVSARRSDEGAARWPDWGQRDGGRGPAPGTTGADRITGGEPR